MKTRTTFVLCAATLLAAACGSNYEAPPPQSGAGQVAPAESPAGTLPGTGKVLETMNAGGYTYVNVDLGGTPVWAAGPEVEVNVGDTVSLPQGMAMRGYHSKTLDRTFDVVYFVGSIDKPGAAKPVEDMGGAQRAHASDAGVAIGSIERVEGGQTVEEIITLAGELAGQDVAVRGKVVKFNAEIMGTNWLHLQDGSGAAGTNDLTITTAATVAVGDTVVVRGKVTVDKDFGAGYRYDVIVENAEVTKE